MTPQYAPLSKAHAGPPLGVEAVSAAARYGVPVLAQGGVEVQNAAALLGAGAAGIAVTGAILMANDPGAAAASLRSALDATRSAR